MADVDVLIVGAGPTGLTLAASLLAHGVVPRVIDRLGDRAHESRALAVQPRTLEVLAGFGLASQLVNRGNPAVRLSMHTRTAMSTAPLFGLGLNDTAYPFLLFVSQAVTEQVIGDHLAGQGPIVERRVELISATSDRTAVSCVLRRPDGSTENVRAQYVVGCDGAHSTVRSQAGIAFQGGSYPQTFALADLSVDGLTPDSVHAFLGTAGILFFFPLDEPAPWRMITMRPAGGWPGAPADQKTRLADLQSTTDLLSGGGLRLRDPVWLTDFRLHHRHAARYRDGRFFLAGDAAHVHSPAGAQGMNTGIQDAVNLGWKLALVVTGRADPRLLDSYDAERRPVGRDVVRFTDRAFTVATSTKPIARLIRAHLVPRLAPVGLRLRRARAYGARAIAELDIHYRDSPAVTDRPHGLRGGPRAGDRLPDGPAPVDGACARLHQLLPGSGFALILYGHPTDWNSTTAKDLTARYPGLVTVHRVGPTTLLEARATGRAAHYLIRPDGHIAYRAAGTDLTRLAGYLASWLSPGRPPARSPWRSSDSPR
jgi:2-polyprenyl-6-methoxyphenol hydroxylase-like FAD-dependent oxidoreductase